MRKRTKKKDSKSLTQIGIEKGFRSGFEPKIADQLEVNGITGTYETVVIEYIDPRTKRYTTDFDLTPNIPDIQEKILIETKGYFEPKDRSKHLLIHNQYPDIEIRFVFMNPRTKLNKTSKTTYALWCDKYGFKWAEKEIPESWIKEAKSKERKFKGK